MFVVCDEDDGHCLTVSLSLHQLEDCTLQLSTNGNYLDLDSSLSEQRDELESFYEDVT